MSSRSDVVYLYDMLDSINAIEQFVAGFEYDSFVSDRKTYSATLRELEIVGYLPPLIHTPPRRGCAGRWRV